MINILFVIALLLLPEMALAAETAHSPLHMNLTHIWTPRLLQAKFSKLMSSTEIKIAAIYSVSYRGLFTSGLLMNLSACFCLNHPTDF
jgi:hypothetical protein